MVRERPNFKFLRILKFWLRDSFFCTLSFLKKKQRSYARIINNLPVSPRSEKPLDKVREHPPKRRSREREER